MKFVIPFVILLFSVSVVGQTNNADGKQITDKNYVSDSCTWFPDGNYSDCCIKHDKEYYFGGSWRARLRSDNKLFKCVASKTKWYNPLIAPIVWAGVRVGGVSFLPTKFRWGFGKTKDKKQPTKKNPPKKKDSD